MQIATASIPSLTEKDKKAFWKRVNKEDETVRRGLTHCWSWIGSRDEHEYGRFSIRRKRGIRFHMFAHRVSYVLEFGEIRDGLFVCHSCDNPSCVRPSHLWLGTQADNSRDKYLKGRVPKGETHWAIKDPARATAVISGERNGCAKLNAAKVVEIRNRRRDGESSASIARSLNLSISAIADASTGRNWGHIPNALPVAVRGAGILGAKFNNPPQAKPGD